VKTIASVSTAKGTAAISCIRLAGGNCQSILASILQSEHSPHRLADGALILDNIVDTEGAIVDHVMAACVAPDPFEITCHGNCLIVERIMNLLREKGVDIVSIDSALSRECCSKYDNTIAAEAALAQMTAVTLDGVKLIGNQAGTGLCRTVARWLVCIDTEPLDNISQQCVEILQRGDIARILINGCKAVIAGQPNSGKSTLLNRLAGKEKAIVTEIAGTTRDWITATCRIGPLVLELTDTAGLCEDLTYHSQIDRTAQEQTSRLIAECDLVLHMIDGSKPLATTGLRTDKPVLTILNKSDIGTAFDESALGIDQNRVLRTSARTGRGIDTFAAKIQEILGISTLDATLPVCFTERQRTLLGRITRSHDKSAVKSLIEELSGGNIGV
jgi:tRNA modification GTPase